MNNHRYPGAQPFQTDQEQIFFGRDEDIARLNRLVKIEPLVLLYAKSGMGKSSLLNAGLIPVVRQEADFLPWGIRFKAWTEGKTEMPAYITRQTITPGGSENTFLDTLISNEASLWHDLKEAQIQGKKLLLIFDQFEELFTYPEAEITAFKTELAEALYSKIPQRYRAILEQQLENGTCQLTDEQIGLLEMPIEVRVIMAIRSDRMSLLNGLSDYLPTVLKNCYELLPLSNEAARTAIIEPARRPQQHGNIQYLTPAFGFEEPAIAAILDFLTDQGSERIESTQLQIICQSVEKKVTKSGQVITAPELGNLTEVIENYYYEQLKSLGDEAAQLPARRFIEEGLIFEEEERRLSIYEGQIFKTYGITPDMLRLLVDAHLLRAEPSLQGGYTYELSHDTLVAPVLKAKHKRKSAEQLLIDAENQRIREAELAEAKRIATVERRKRQRSNLLAAVAVVAFLLAGWFYVDARNKGQIAEAEKIKAETALLKADSLGTLATNNAKALSIKAKELSIKVEEVTAAKAEAEKNLALAEKNERIAQQALLDVKNEQKATEKAKQEALKNLDIAVQKTKEAKENLALAEQNKKDAEAERDKTLQALQQAKDANNKTVVSNLKEIDYLLKEDSYDEAILKWKATYELNSLRDTIKEKCYSMLDLIINEREYELVFLFLKESRQFELSIDSVKNKYLRLIDNCILTLEYDKAINVCKEYKQFDLPKDTILKRLYELAYYYTEIDSIEATITALNLAEARNFPANQPGVQEKMRSYLALNMPKGLYSFYEKRYYPDMVPIKGDTFTMGSNVNQDEQPQHSVRIGDFKMAATETTVWQYNLYCKTFGKIMPEQPDGWGGIGNNPILYVSWNMAKEYSDSLSSIKKAKFRLPTEAEWEFAARGGQDFQYAGSANIEDVAWYGDNSGSKTHPVGQKSKNGYGLYDMSGNVWEWCLDWYDGDYYQKCRDEGVVTDPKGPVEEGSLRVLRGGGWDGGAEDCRVAGRDFPLSGGPGLRCRFPPCPIPSVRWRLSGLSCELK